jgi:hypothetical protein
MPLADRFAPTTASRVPIDLILSPDKELRHGMKCVATWRGQKSV